jgi:citrate lyase subunit beta/citryl-CoA lyase
VTVDPSRATTWLFVPGSRPDRFEKALSSGADLVILDLEDAVAPDEKDAARAVIAEFLAAGATAAVRINPPGTSWHTADLEMVAAWSCTVMVPKAEDAETMTSIATRTGSAVVPLIESAAGVLNAPSIAAADGVCRLALGNADLAAQLGVDPSDQTALLWTRSALVAASARANIPAPIDGVTLTVTDPSSAAADAAHARRLGFRGKLCIHPAQVLPVKKTFAPTAAEIDWAKRVVAAGAGEGVATVDGSMVDRPVLLRARSILADTATSDD